MMIRDLDQWLTRFLHLVMLYGSVLAGQVLVNNTELNNTTEEWSNSYRYRGVPNVTTYNIITSPGFPDDCCTASNITLNASVVDGKRQHMFLVCTDFDVPQHSQVRLWANQNAFMPEITWQGHRTRPIHWLPRGSLRVDFQPTAKQAGQMLAGFRCIVWETSKDVGLDEWVPRPSDSCDRLSDKPLANGAVEVGIWPSQLRIDFFYDCVWQVKLPNLPDSHEEWYVYVHVQEMDVDGLVEIREGLDSTAPLLATNRKYPPPNYRHLESLHQPQDGFVSKKGLFVKLIKPYYNGTFVFNYGTFAMKRNTAPAPLSDYDTYENALTCTLHINQSRTVDGFLCNSTQRCIPIEYTCNDYPNCPDGSDEGDICRAEFFSLSCKPGQRECQSGICVPKSERCPEDACPEDRPHKCDNDYTCFGPSEMCDGQKFCSDGADEDCSQHYDFSHIYPYLAAICVICFLLIILFVAVWYWKRRGSRRRPNTPSSDLPLTGIHSNVEQEALIDDGAPTPPNGSVYEDNINQGADQESTSSLTMDAAKST